MPSRSFSFTIPPTTAIYPLSLHDALPISTACRPGSTCRCRRRGTVPARVPRRRHRSEEHTSELQSHVNLVCRLLLENKKNQRPRLQPRSRLPSPCITCFT